MREPMSPPIDPDATLRSAFVLYERHEAGIVPWHSHRRMQLLHVSEGVLTVQTEHALWVVPPERAVWVLPGVLHRAQSSRAYTVCTLFLDPVLLRTVPPDSVVVEVEPLVRELLLAAAAFGPEYEPGSAEERLIHVALDRLPTVPVRSLRLPEPTDARLRPIIDALRAEPSDGRSLSEWGREVGMSERSAERLFQDDLGMSFSAWRQQLRLVVALECLGRGDRVTDVAFAVGYSDVSAFIAMFKAALGATPGQYFRGERRRAQAKPQT
jgi:AraC-like DNA-binding protein